MWKRIWISLRNVPFFLLFLCFNTLKYASVSAPFQPWKLDAPLNQQTRHIHPQHYLCWCLISPFNVLSFCTTPVVHILCQQDFRIFDPPPSCHMSATGSPSMLTYVFTPEPPISRNLNSSIKNTLLCPYITFHYENFTNQQIRDILLRLGYLVVKGENWGPIIRRDPFKVSGPSSNLYLYENSKKHCFNFWNLLT